MSFKKLILSASGLCLFVSLFTASGALAWGRHYWGGGPRVGWGPGYAGPYGWHGGYWFHGAYGSYVGWWWIVGPSWYYYPSPVYPYPPTDSPPVYIVQNAPAPPAPAPAPAAQAPSVIAPPPVPAAGDEGKKNSQKAFSYYCAKANNYYPVVKTCPDAWAVSPVKGPN